MYVVYVCLKALEDTCCILTSFVDNRGLGKTIESLAGAVLRNAAAKKTNKKPTLIVCPQVSRNRMAPFGLKPKY